MTRRNLTACRETNLRNDGRHDSKHVAGRARRHGPYPRSHSKNPQSQCRSGQGRLAMKLSGKLIRRWWGEAPAEPKFFRGLTRLHVAVIFVALATSSVAASNSCP